MPKKPRAAPDTLAARLRARRESCGLTTRQLAAAAGISQSAVTHLECGRRTRPGYGTLAALARALGCEPGELMNGGR